MKKVLVIDNEKLGFQSSDDLQVFSIDSLRIDDVKDVVDEYDIVVNAFECKTSYNQLSLLSENSSLPIAIAGKVLENPGKQFVQISTFEVYKSSEKLLTEDSPKIPENSYGYSKKLADEYLENIIKLNTGNILVLRPGLLVDDIVQQVGSESELVIQNDSRMSLVCAKDIHKAINRFIYKTLPGGIYNIARRKFMTRAELAETIKKEIDSPCIVKTESESKSGFMLDSSKIEQFIEFKKDGDFSFLF